ncbi:hypothetical protein C5708_05665 [Caulobacter sp. CCUG 60055]|nr:hypothetical protein [Caulobacter sp. CCUG 60055]
MAAWEEAVWTGAAAWVLAWAWTWAGRAAAWAAWAWAWAGAWGAGAAPTAAWKNALWAARAASFDRAAGRWIDAAVGGDGGRTAVKAAACGERLTPAGSGDCG